MVTRDSTAKWFCFYLLFVFTSPVFTSLLCLLLDDGLLNISSFLHILPLDIVRLLYLDFIWDEYTGCWFEV